MIKLPFSISFFPFLINIKKYVEVKYCLYRLALYTFNPSNSTGSSRITLLSSRAFATILSVSLAYHPKMIFVVAVAVIAVIGTDVAGVCHYRQEKVNVVVSWDLNALSMTLKNVWCRVQPGNSSRCFGSCENA